MNLIDGKKVSDEIRQELAEKVLPLKEAGEMVPGLVTILVGADPASQIYVKMKNKACAKIGMLSEQLNLPSEISQEELLNIVNKYNADEKFHGILVQLPLPDHIDENVIINAIDPAKDVDGFHPVSVGNLVIGNDTFFPCTPFGIVELLKRYDIPTRGKHVVVVGRSNIVGKPVANLLVQKRDGANAIVTIAHSAAPDLAAITRQADILIAAIGRAEMITADMVKENAVVIDVGINRVDAPEMEKGYKVVGDVKFDEVSEKASWITPVPRGVGPMTITMLLNNTYKAFKKITGK